MVKKFSAEFVGTMVLVLFGCGAAVLGPAPFDQLAVSMAFGLAIVAMAYGIGPVSGCHVNPAVSLAAFIAGCVAAGLLVLAVLGFVGGRMYLLSDSGRGLVTSLARMAARDVVAAAQALVAVHLPTTPRITSAKLCSIVSTSSDGIRAALGSPPRRWIALTPLTNMLASIRHQIHPKKNKH